MKILILGLGRSGTTSLLNGLNASINNSLRLFEVFNPFSPDYADQNYINHKNFLKNQTTPLIEKNLISDLTKHISHTEVFASLSFYQLIHSMPLFQFITNFYIKYFKSFDKIILMSRRNLKESTISWVNCSHYKNFFEPYKPNPSLDIKDKLLEFEFYQKVLEDISLKLNIPITYYEDIYTGNKQDLQTFLKKTNIQVDNFEILFEHLHPKNRLRQN